MACSGVNCTFDLVLYLTTSSRAHIQTYTYIWASTQSAGSQTLARWVWFKQETAASSEGRHSTYNVTMSRLLATIFAVVQQYVLHIVCVCVCVCV